MFLKVKKKIAIQVNGNINNLGHEVKISIDSHYVVLILQDYTDISRDKSSTGPLLDESDTPHPCKCSRPGWTEL